MATPIRVAADADIWSLLTATAEVLPRVLLYGPPGTGKTYVAATAGIRPGEVVSRVNFTEDTPAAEFRGHYIPRGNEWTWHDGPVMERYRNGGRLVADEITRATDDALSFMLGILDGLPVTLPSDETVSPHPDFSVWATTNDDPSALTDALADRFTVKAATRTVNPAALKLLPKHVAAAISVSGDGISLREAQEFCRLMPLAGAHVAARLVWEGRATDILSGLDMAARL